MSKKKNNKIKLELQKEDWRALGISRKRGGAGPHLGRDSKRKRTRHDADEAAIEESLESWKEYDSIHDWNE